MLLRNVLRDFLHYLTITNKSKETIKSYNSDLTSFEHFLEVKYNCAVYINEIKSLDVEDYLYHLRERSLKSSSISRNLYTLRSLWNYAYKNKLCEWNITTSLEPVKIQRKERTFLNSEEINIFINNIDHPLIKTVVQTLFYTGMRISECLNLKIENIDLDNEIIHVINGKGSKDRDLPINKTLLPILKNHLISKNDEANNNYVFSTKRSGHLSSPYVNRILDDTVKKLGWKKHISAHILRHSFASNLIKNGVSIVYVQKLLGHSNLKVTSIYTHADMEELNKSINVL